MAHPTDHQPDWSTFSNICFRCGYEREPTLLKTASDVTEAVMSLLEDIGNACYGLGNRWQIDWERFYEYLDTHGYELDEMGSPADNKIRRIVNRMVKEGEIS